MGNTRRWALSLLIVAGLILPATAHAGGLHLKDGHWRIEVQGLAGTNLGGGKHSGDFGVITELEYETPFAKRWTLSFKAIPVLYYNQDLTDDDHVFGVGAGMGLRVYQRAEERTGLFAEIGASPIVHINRFESNGSNINFLIEAGVGYKFRSGWHVAAKYAHISNSSLDEDNAGTNSWSIAAGVDL